MQFIITRLPVIDPKKIEAKLKIMIPLRNQYPYPRLQNDLAPRGATADFVVRILADINHPTRSSDVRSYSSSSHVAPGIYILSASAKLTKFGREWSRLINFQQNIISKFQINIIRNAHNYHYCVFVF